MIVDSPILGDISDKHYTVKIADTEKQVINALKLRYEIFYVELDRNFKNDATIDEDKFDKQCHHLIVIDNNENEIVGTYRLQTIEQAEKGFGFYSGTYFFLDGFPEDVLINGFEVGRACIKQEHRNGRVLYLLWKGFAGYLQFYKKRYLFGNLGISIPNEESAVAMYSQLINEEFIHPSIQLQPKKQFKCTLPLKNTNGNSLSATKASPLLQNYIDIGCAVCSKPAFHPDLKLLYIMILLDVHEISDKVRRLFFG
ncbi:GNAT family N-acetyltransferase [soil metagenome]